MNGKANKKKAFGKENLLEKFVYGNMECSRIYSHYRHYKIWIRPFKKTRIRNTKHRRCFVEENLRRNSAFNCISEYNIIEWANYNVEPMFLLVRRKRKKT
jgi:hypothetical protein